jgi:hypothetical protein
MRGVQAYTERPERHDTGSQRGKGKWVAAVPRQIGHLFTGNGLSERGGFGLHQDRFFIDSDDIGDLAHLKRDVDSRGLIDRQFELGGKLGKTGHLGRQAVLTRQYGKEGLFATAVCLGG